MQKISAVISAYNEEKKIEECLASVSWVDEIIFVNSSSTDKTAEIARRYTTKIFTRPNHPMLNTNKNFGFSKASSHWILCLDADERITKELREEIQALLQNPNQQIHGYKIPRKNIIFGKWMEHAGWYPDYQLRLFRKGFGIFEEHHVHETVQIKGEIEPLNEHILHYNYETIHQFLYKLANIYAPNEAYNLTRKRYVFDYLDAIRFPAREFLRRFFAQQGYKDGFHGFVLSFLMAFYHFVVFCHLWEQEKFKEQIGKELFFELEKECKNQRREFGYWLTNVRKDLASNPLDKLWFFLVNKIKR